MRPNESSRPGFLARALRVLRTQGLMGIWSRICKPFYRRRDIILAVRDNEMRVPRFADRLSPQGTYRLARSDDGRYWAEARPDQHEEALGWLADLENFGCMIFINEADKLRCFGWYTYAPRKEKHLGLTFDAGPHGVYWFGGWTAPEWRGKAIPLVGMNILFRTEFPRRQVRWILTWYDELNRPSRRIHERYHFVEYEKIVHRRIGPWRFNKRIPLAPDPRLAEDVDT